MTAIGVLSRGMTAAELRDYLDADADLAPLSSKLRANVDVNLLLELVKVAMSCSAPIGPAIMPYFEEADFALCGKLELRLNSLLIERRREEGGVVGGCPEVGPE